MNLYGLAFTFSTDEFIESLLFAGRTTLMKSFRRNWSNTKKRPYLELRRKEQNG